MEYVSKILPETLAELGKMEYANLVIVCATVAVAVAVWKLPEIIRARKGK